MVLVVRLPKVLTTGLFVIFFGGFWMGLFLSGAHAEVTLPAIFGDHMVLQRGMTLPIWGNADPGEQVSVQIAGQSTQTKANASGNWRVTLRPLPAFASPETLVVEGKNRIEIQDVLLGDVWICAGEGNMAFPLSDAVGGKDTPEAMADSALRFFVSTNQPSLHPDRQGAGNWIVCTPEEVLSLSSVGYFFARDLRSSHHLPIGMVQCTSDDAPAQSWISRKGLAAHPAFSNDLAELAAKESPKNLDGVSTRTPSSLFNGVIAPLIPYAMTGVLWYQGESNEGLAALGYRRLFPRLIRDWRQQWEQGPFPFFFVQPAGFGGEDAPVVEPFYGKDHGATRGIPWLREGMASALTLPNTGMAVTTDIGVSDDIQSPDKLDVGRRLALLARKRVYGEELVDEGPTYRSIKIEGAKVRISFVTVGGGLTLGSSPFQADDTLPIITTGLRGFALAGADGRWFAATGLIDGNSVLLASDAVPHPEAVRYNWSGFPEGNLYNREGLPAAPFRTDAWQPDRAK